MKSIGFLLVLVGILGLLYGGAIYGRQRYDSELGSARATRTEQPGLPIAHIVGSIAIAGGLLLVVRHQHNQHMI